MCQKGDRTGTKEGKTANNANKRLTSCKHIRTQTLTKERLHNKWKNRDDCWYNRNSRCIINPLLSTNTKKINKKVKILIHKLNKALLERGRFAGTGKKNAPAFANHVLHEQYLDQNRSKMAKKQFLSTFMPYTNNIAKRAHFLSQSPQTSLSHLKQLPYINGDLYTFKSNIFFREKYQFKDIL